MKSSECVAPPPIDIRVVDGNLETHTDQEFKGLHRIVGRTPGEYGEDVDTGAFLRLI